MIAKFAAIAFGHAVLLWLLYLVVAIRVRENLL
jgi:hypothetical protein